MEPIVIIVGLVAALVMFGLAAVTWGVDSRDGLRDDHSPLDGRPSHDLDHRSRIKEPTPMHPLIFLALDIAETAPVRPTSAGGPRSPSAASRSAPSWPRRLLANVFALVSRGSAGLAHRLDECVADDLRRTLATTK